MLPANLRWASCSGSEFGITETTFYRWQRKYSGITSAELRELRQLREEN